MKKVIANLLYNTDSARLVGHREVSPISNIEWLKEDLYQKKTGEFFLHGRGGPRTIYRQTTENGNFSGGERILPISQETAKEWAENYLSVDAYNQLFGEIVEDGTRRIATFSLTESALEYLSRESVARRTTKSALIEEFIMANCQRQNEN